jgi:hypothetical protein
VVLLTRGKPPAPSTAPSTAVLAIKLALGVVLILYAVRQERRRGRPRKTPARMAWLDGFSAWERGGAGRLPAAVDARRGGRGHGQPGQALERVGVAGPAAVLPAGHLQRFLYLELSAAFRPAAAGALIEKMRTWLDTHQAQVIIIICLLLGFWLAGKSIYLLVT